MWVLLALIAVAGATSPLEPIEKSSKYYFISLKAFKPEIRNRP